MYTCILNTKIFFTYITSKDFLQNLQFCIEKGHKIFL